MWLLREIRAQLSRFALALGLFSVGVIAFGTSLPMIDSLGRPSGASRISGESPVGLENAMIGYREGWFVVGIASAALLLLGIYRRYRYVRPVVAALVATLALTVAAVAGRAAAGELLDPCGERGPAGYLGVQECEIWPVGYAQREPGFGFAVVEIGAAGLALAGLVLLAPAPAPRPRRRRFAGRQDVVWL